MEAIFVKFITKHPPSRLVGGGFFLYTKITVILTFYTEKRINHERS